MHKIIGRRFRRCGQNAAGHGCARLSNQGFSSWKDAWPELIVEGLDPGQILKRPAIGVCNFCLLTFIVRFHRVTGADLRPFLQAGTPAVRPVRDKSSKAKAGKPGFDTADMNRIVTA
ncbi:hypothetical protein SAMN02927900_03716 [Rhizobium mongolense subsp. loessense]|uniref:Uncharacterized protein n=1 Tax=Rhizobium mongolense subsp. loessense TaxID=158890 RepID=A0A1G4SFN3_9HYPH|nr:hypothetical protein SAMN02927900_03716 [Rhizobium mongolense subsp. loessense]